MKTIVIDVLGAAGHGKTTVASLLADFLSQHFPKAAITVSNPGGEKFSASQLDQRVEALQAGPLRIDIRERNINSMLGALSD